MFQFLIKSVHSYTSPLFNWTSSWLYWRTLFVILHTDNFWAQSLTTSWILFFVDNPDQKFLLFWNLIGRVEYTPTLALISFDQVLDQVEEHFSWNCIPTLFLAQNLTTTWVNFSLTTQIIIFFFLRFYWEAYALILALVSFEKFWLDWKTYFVKLHTDTFLSAKFDNDMNTFFRKQARSKNPSISEPTRTSTLLL